MNEDNPNIDLEPIQCIDIARLLGRDELFIPTSFDVLNAGAILIVLRLDDVSSSIVAYLLRATSHVQVGNSAAIRCDCIRSEGTNVRFGLKADGRPKWSNGRSADEAAVRCRCTKGWASNVCSADEAVVRCRAARGCDLNDRSADEAAVRCTTETWQIPCGFAVGICQRQVID